MLTISEAQRRTELFLTGQMLEALRAVEYGLPSFDTLDASTLAVRLCQSPAMPNGRCRIHSGCSPGAPEVRAGNPSRSLTRVMRRWRQKITFSVSEQVKGVITDGLLASRLQSSH
jgi:hypothetical protein